MTLLGYILPEEQATAVTSAIEQAFVERNLPFFWTTGKYQILSGEHAGLWFIPADDTILDTPLMGNPPLTPRDEPEFTTIIDSLGGLEARVEIESSSITPPEEP